MKLNSCKIKRIVAYNSSTKVLLVKFIPLKIPLFTGYLHYKTVTSQNVSSKAQVNGNLHYKSIFAIN